MYRRTSLILAVILFLAAPVFATGPVVIHGGQPASLWIPPVVSPFELPLALLSELVDWVRRLVQETGPVVIHGG